MGITWENANIGAYQTGITFMVSQRSSQPAPFLTGRPIKTFLRMKKLVIKAIILLIWLFPAVLIAQDEEDLKTYTREKDEKLHADKFSRVEIDNKHGDISFKAWDKDSIRVDVVAHVKAEDEDSGEDVLDHISLESSEEENALRFTTTFEEDFYSSHPFNVSYEVYMPAGHDLKVRNRFGNINIASITGHMEIDLEFGDINQKGDAPIEDIDAKLAFGKADMGSFNNAKIELINAGIKLRNTENGDFSGKYCQIDLDRAGKVTIDTATGRLNIGKVNDIELTGDFCFASIEQIQERGHIEITNGLLLIDSVTDRLKELAVNNDNAPINLSLPKSLSYTLHGEATNGQFRHYRPENFRIVKDMDKVSFSGDQNPEKEDGASIVLFSKNAGINIDDQ